MIGLGTVGGRMGVCRVARRVTFVRGAGSGSGSVLLRLRDAMEAALRMGNLCGRNFVSARIPRTPMVGGGCGCGTSRVFVQCAMVSWPCVG